MPVPSNPKFLIPQDVAESLRRAWWLALFDDDGLPWSQSSMPDEQRTNRRLLAKRMALEAMERCHDLQLMATHNAAMAKAANANVCTASLVDYFKTGGKPSDVGENGRVQCPACGRRIKLVQSKPGIYSLLAEHNWNRTKDPKDKYARHHA